MTIGTPLWDDFVENLREVKLTVEGMGFMPVNSPSDKELQAMSPDQKNIVEEEFKNFYSCYAETWTRVVHNNMFVKVEKVNEEIRDLYYIKVARVGSKHEVHPEADPNDLRLVFEIEFVKQLFDDYKPINLEIWHTFTDTTLDKILGL